MYVDIVISNAFNLNKHFFFFFYFLCLIITKTRYPPSVDGRELPLHRRQQVTSSGELVLAQVSQRDDQGTYTCTAKDKQGRSAFETMHLAVVGEYCYQCQ